MKLEKVNNDPDLTTLSLLGQGQAMIRLGNISEGIALLDESMVAVESADISPLVVGIVYCAVIETCQMIFDIPTGAGMDSGIKPVVRITARPGAFSWSMPDPAVTDHAHSW